MRVEIITAKNAGMCYGVKRAVERAKELAGKGAVCGELIHNNDVLRELESRGMLKIDRIADCPRDRTLMIRSHGIGADEYAEIAALGLTYEDMTCPHVAKIHKIVAKMSNEGCGVIIAGDKTHPEVKGIRGHTAKNAACFTVNSVADLKELTKSDNHDTGFRHNALILVAQTTFVLSKWRDYKEFLKKHCTNLQIFDTICSTTTLRQEEAEILSGKCDLMVVLGSPESSNSRKLADICKKKCQTLFIENAGQLETDKIKVLLAKKRRTGTVTIGVGIAAGASTPAEKIEEVHSIMSEELKGVIETDSVDTTDVTGEIDFMAEVDKTFKRVYIGNRVRASVVSVNRSEVVVDIGTKHSGYIPADELSNDSSKLPTEIVKSGDEIECVVISINDAEGVVYLSKKKVDSALGLQKIAEAETNNATLTGNVAAVVKGGLIVTCEGAKVFVPASQSGVPKNGRLEDLARKEVRFKIIEVNESRGRIVGSVRAALKEENDAKKEVFWGEIAEGKRYKGEVKSIESYGVFVDLGGVDGMVHLSELTWSRVRHPKEIVSIGDKLDVYVKSFDPERRRVSLGAKDPDANPWANFAKDFNIGDVVNVEVVSLTPFGAFAQIMPGVDGLIHISQIARERVSNVAQVLTVGQKVDAKITDIDEEKGRISLSIKELLEPLPEEAPVASDDDVSTENDIPADLQEVIDSGDSDSSPREQLEVVYSDDDKKPDESTGELPVHGDEAVGGEAAETI
ncbi:MAG: bifunctional 4-hydroxy-3-methylbut-2-enyl diphosphate reductase/30S ribosomal protein S1 [Oscillospiraceae bacterium]|jgi:4-hydroxy-3-methylbut-2-enyl diphosphate reductase|nr:bifunctional 4-hydroxy-3-methylbut-2-enyl diphosphate reductase/30S ribosomal protein S1 [Oscillospiraceae bacterium]